MCPIVGALVGAAVTAGATNSDDGGVYAGGAAIGGALGYLLCREKEKPAAPMSAPMAATPPAPPPPPLPAPAAPEVGSKIVSLEGTNFDFNKATLRPEAIAKLDHAVAVMTENPAIKVSVEGHTDSVGSDAYNQKLSERRAQAVVSYLTSKGINAARLTSVGYGESRPVASNDTADGRAHNRRVDLVIAAN
ncbi:MAG: OmpA family protein [Gammaproteobacteria bacterium]|nr:OmpA family protein [Gammaproteobacteria bacterium]